MSELVGITVPLVAKDGRALGVYKTAMNAHRSADGERVFTFLVKERAFWDGHRLRAGDVVEVPLVLLKKDNDGNHVIPSWAVPDTESNRQEIADRPGREAREFAAAAIAASGSTGNRRKRDSFQDAMRTGASRNADAEAAARAASGDAGAKAKRAEFDQHRVADLPIPHDSRK
jgi:hypothetical protein